MSLRRLPLAAPLLSLTAAVFVAACSGGESASAQLEAGMSRDSALMVLNQARDTSDAAAPADTLRNIWRKSQYLVNGHMVEVVWYSSANEHRTPTDTVPSKRVTPVIFIDGKLIGAGSAVYERTVNTYRLPNNKY